MIENTPGCPLHGAHFSCVHRKDRRHPHEWERCTTCDNGDLFCPVCQDHLEYEEIVRLYRRPIEPRPSRSW